MAVEDVLRKTGPRKMLALDGGGIRGMISLGILAHIEKLLREEARNDKLVLADYFDYMAGTSTGAIIATCLSWGMSVEQVRRFYEENGASMFDRAALWELYRYKFRHDKLEAKLQELFGRDTLLGTDRLRTLLMLVLRNASTDSPWPISNHPEAKYNHRTRLDCNLDLPLWQLIRASTAAPTYFPPESVKIGSREFIFVDGGITMYNNPAFQLFLMATAEPYNLGWPTGEDRMLIVSVGTGVSAAANADLEPSELNVLYNASSIPGALMTAALHEQDFLCRVFGKCLVGDVLDREVGDMIGKSGPVSPKLFTYLRYNVELDRPTLDALGFPYLIPREVQKLDSIACIDELSKIGDKVGRLKVEAEHLAAFPP